VREARDRSVGRRDRATRPKLVEAVLRRDPHRHAGERAGGEPEEVGVHEMGVQHVRPPEREPRRHARIEIEAHPPRFCRHVLRAHALDELVRTRLVLVEHQHRCVEAAGAQSRQE